MKVLLQRVSCASVTVAGEVVGAIGAGLLLLVGFSRSDLEPDLRAMARKIVALRVFPDQQGRFNYSLLDVGGGVLLVPQFTLYAQTNRGRRPDFTAAMHPEGAIVLFNEFVQCVSDSGVKKVETGCFGADMKVDLINDGPVTIMLEG